MAGKEECEAGNMTSKKSKLMRVHVDLANTIDARWRMQRGEVSKVRITKEIADTINGRKKGSLKGWLTYKI